MKPPPRLRCASPSPQCGACAPGGGPVHTEMSATSRLRCALHAPSARAPVLRISFRPRAIGQLAILASLWVPVCPAAAGCAVPDLTSNAARAVCVIDPAAVSRIVELQAHFRGFHDDSEAVIAVRRNGAAVPCEPGARTELSRESGAEGDVSLFCRFAVEPTGAAGSSVEALLRFRHAEFDSVRLLTSPVTKP